jgi:hypothetical protein
MPDLAGEQHPQIAELSPFEQHSHEQGQRTVMQQLGGCGFDRERERGAGYCDGCNSVGAVGHDARMGSYVSHTTVDCANAYTLSVWWQGVLDYGMDPHDPNEPGHEECLIISPDGHHRILFIEVPEGKQVKNRIHFDLRPREATRDEELARLLVHGATEVHDLRQPDGRGWVVLADPEGNEFCILRGEAEVAANQARAAG